MELVYYKGLQDEPYTTAEIIAEYSGVDLDSINRLTRTHKERLSKFGKVGFEIRSLESGQKSKIWKYNEQQATVLITYLRNTDKVLDFKDTLVSAFYNMKHELDERKIHRQVNRVVNIGFGDVIKAHYPDSKHAYSNFHRLAYKYALGVTPKQIKDQRHTDDPQNALTSDESARLERAKQQISLFIQDGYDYEDIKAKLFADI
ncbi:Rha family transcriptional regulator [Leuconostoc inhae]|uniref:Rha family transcriptional regulator n=1 Tax=Leuconostoc inhae TaxID=178001 RepID=UPI001C7D28B6|nr:Rha family transcriptional regulator [Leuconostoc inhae]